MTSPSPTPERKRSILQLSDSLLHPGSWRVKRARSGSRSESPISSVASTPGVVPAQDVTQASAHCHDPFPGSSPEVTPQPSSPDTQDSGTPLPNPIPDSPPKARPWTFPAQNISGESWVGLARALRALHLTSKICPPLHNAIDSLQSCLHIFEEAAKLRKDYDELSKGLTAMVNLLIKHLPTAASMEMADTIARISGDIIKEVGSIQKRQSSHGARRILGQSGDEDDLIRRYRRIEQLFRQLQAEASMSTWNDTKRQFIVRTRATLCWVDDDIFLWKNTQLENLDPVKLATFNSKISMDIGRRSCTENTRTQILQESMTWANNPNGAKIYWLNGMAGTGKTTITYSLCERLNDAGQLAASFFCTRASRECGDAKQIVPTIAYQFARRSAPFRDALCSVLDKDPDAGNLSTSSQFRSLIAKPLLEANEAIGRNLVIVIDALDECSDPHAVKVVLDILFRFAPDSPIKFFVTSRPEPVIRDSMMAWIVESDRQQSILYLHEIEKSLVQADIELYLKDELKHMLPTHQSDIEELAEQAGNLFIYAATATRYIQAAGKGFNSKRLKTVLGVNKAPSKSLSAIDVLYSAILSAAIGDSALEPDEQDYIQTALWTAVCACEPVLIDTLANLSGLHETELAVSALQPLRSVLHISEHNNLVTTLHASFPDFMFSQERSQDFFCDRASHGQFLARRCLEIMRAQLRFNICQLESSFDLDDEVPDLKNRVEMRISPELFYACRFWVDHLITRQEKISDSLGRLAFEFLSKRLLFWIEVLNLKKCVVTGAVASTTLYMWLQTYQASSDLTELARDAQIFVGKYASNPVSASTPHIYISALPLSSPTSLVRLTYGPRFRGLAWATGLLMEQTDQAALEIWSIGAPIRSASFSADRKRIVIGNDNGRIIIKDPDNGGTIIEFKAHRKPITSVAFSNDAELVVSSSNDCTVCVWSSGNGLLASGPFKGHSGRVTSVAFSPDSMRLVSGSVDSSIRIWTTHNCSNFQLLTGHAAAVRSVTFSPDGLQIASGSDDSTIHIWDGLNGVLLHSLRGHIQSVNCVQFSPCSAFLFSGSNDRTIRMWDPHNGTPSGNTFTGHSKRVTYISISPEGERIVSGSLDRTIRVWHRATGKLMADPFEGHTDAVRSVGFSADGARIISTSDDGTVRVWNAQGKAQCNAECTSTKNSPILRATLSPDGMYIASGHEDGSVQVRSAQSYALKTHCLLNNDITRALLLISFSPNATEIIAAYTNGLLYVLNVQTGELTGDPRRFSSHNDVGYPIALSPDGRSMVSGRDNRKTLDLWDLEANQLVCSIGANSNALEYFAQAFFSSNDSRLALSTQSGTVVFWDRYTGQQVAGPFHFKVGANPRISVSPDQDRIIYRCPEGDTWVYNVTNRKHTMISVPPGFLWDCVLLLPNEPYFVFVGLGYRGSVMLYHAGRDELIGNLVIGDRYLENLTFTSNESFLVLSHRAGDIQIYQVRANMSNVFSAPGNDGWIQDEKSNKAIWVPPEIRKEFMWTNGTYLTDKASLSVNYDNILIGDKWTQCYIEE